MSIYYQNMLREEGIIDSNGDCIANITMRPETEEEKQARIDKVKTFLDNYLERHKGDRKWRCQHRTWVP